MDEYLKARFKRPVWAGAPKGRTPNRIQKNALSGISEFCILAALSVSFALSSNGQTLPNGQAVYTLINGSSLTDDCPVCDRITIPVPMQGAFNLRLVDQGPLFINYAVENVAFTAGQPGGRTYKISGHGTYRIGGEIATQQELVLEAFIDDGITNELCEFSNSAPQVSRLWPMLQTAVGQTNGTPQRQYSLTLDAAPFREIWFSTASNFQSSIWNPPSNAISAGDLLASSGRMVKGNRQLMGQLGVQPPVPDLGLKDIDILPDGEIAFSIEQTIFSETLGQLTTQDLLSDRGRIVRRTNPDLIKNFQPVPPLPDPVGLEAVQITDGGEMYFSVQNGFNSAKLGLRLQPGDLLSDKGTVVRTGQQLLAAFGPQKTNDVGLKSVYVWPSGEIWFSTRDGFTSTNGAHFGAGDLLSDQGYLVYSNAELVATFSPAGSLGDLGLDALFVVSDVVPVTGSPTALVAPQFADDGSSSVILRRSNGSRVFQLEAATNVTGPFSTISAMTTDKVFTDAGAQTNSPQRFYRLHQW
ncbi:MAG TPA: hypothetical protein VFE51_02195 [Verrucomicrobiae bacterium]|nr:hypothetical protein [Verrucomicrobiae bacterium]